MFQLLRRLVVSQRGATAVEYGLICALIILGMMAGLINFAHSTINMWNNVTTSSTNVL